MANCNPPVKGQAFDLSTSLYKTDGTLIANPGTLTLKISKDFGDWADSHNSGSTPTEEDSTYGQIKIALDATDMNADVVDVYLVDNTSGCVPFRATIYTAAAVWAGVGAAMTLADDAITAGKFDESTAFPLKSADTGATILARPGDAMTLAADAVNAAAIKEDAGTEIGAAVWSAVSRTLTAFGFEVTATVDEGALAAAIVAAIEAEGIEATVDETAVALAITTALGSLSVTVASPVGSGGIITVHAGDDYLDAEGRAIAFSVADATHTYLLDDGTAVVKFKSAQATWTATNITSTAGGYIVKFEPEADDTAALTYKQAYEVEATLTSTSVVTLCTGNLVVVRDIPAGA